MFESIDVTMPRNRKKWINMEEHCLARDLVNIIAYEGKEKVERKELFGKWKSRFTMAGFWQFPPSSYVNSVIRSLFRLHRTLYASGDGWCYAFGVEGPDSGISICLLLIRAIWKEEMEK
ncbi:hypothetical protein ACH5RR_027978 [Cinchona calisaya]|uniref:Uncharacterized protein n=1 Tax=Cinchona calisaya TaxID=153742 RepID=A0ABD2YRW2_9GENT